jgi:hypothetical protein
MPVTELCQRDQRRDCSGLRHSRISLWLPDEFRAPRREDLPTPAPTVVRDGALRCQGAFADPILTELLGAVGLLPTASLLWDVQGL